LAQVAHKIAVAEQQDLEASTLVAVVVETVLLLVVLEVLAEQVAVEESTVALVVTQVVLLLIISLVMALAFFRQMAQEIQAQEFLQHFQAVVQVALITAVLAVREHLQVVAVQVKQLVAQAVREHLQVELEHHPQVVVVVVS
jgi:hypothetical protein